MISKTLNKYALLQKAKSKAYEMLCEVFNFDSSLIKYFRMSNNYYSNEVSDKFSILFLDLSEREDVRINSTRSTIVVEDDSIPIDSNETLVLVKKNSTQKYCSYGVFKQVRYDNDVIVYCQTKCTLKQEDLFSSNDTKIIINKIDQDVYQSIHS